MVRRSTLAIVARHAFRMILPVSASASCSRSMTSSSECSSPTIERTSSRLCACGKISRAVPENGPSNDCCTATRLGALPRSTSWAAARAGHDIDGRDRQQNLLADHLAQTGGGAADAHIGDFGKRVLLDVRELACIDSSLLRFLQAKSRAGQKCSKSFIRQRFSDKRGIKFPRARDNFVLQVGGDDRDRHLRMALAGSSPPAPGRRYPAC